MNQANPYMGRASRDGKVWEDVIKEGKLLKVICITDVMLINMWACDDFYRGSTREKDWSFYHDGLTLWFEEKAQDYLKTLTMRDGTVPAVLTYLDREIRIEGPSNGNVNVHKRYQNSVTGNRHEKMPLDTQLFAALNSDLSMNMAATYDLPDSDPMKFRFNGFEAASSAMRRVISCIPQERIIQDIQRWSSWLERLWRRKAPSSPRIKRRGKGTTAGKQK
jgi:hypothetical protein